MLSYTSSVLDLFHEGKKWKICSFLGSQMHGICTILKTLLVVLERIYHSKNALTDPCSTMYSFPL